MKSGKNNMFDSKFYIPILKWKRAEQDALAELADEHKDRVAPLIELVMPKPKSLFKDKERTIRKKQEELFHECITIFKTKRFSAIPDEIFNSWGTRPIFIDFSLLYTIELKEESIQKIFKKSYEYGAKLIPVLNLSDNDKIKNEIKKVFKKYSNGVCIRIVSGDLENIDKLNKDLYSFLQYLDTSRSNVDLLVDIKEKGVHYRKYFATSQKIEELVKWRNFIFACGTFPDNLSECKLDKPNNIPRTEWTNWLDLKDEQLNRVPTFADYTVRNPIYDEKLQYFHPTASIKYTFEDEWFILKGKAKKFGMYLANASLLVENSKFYGEDFSSGDKFIAEKAKHFKVYTKNPKVKGTGNTQMWLTAFINHHLTLAAHQIAKLS